MSGAVKMITPTAALLLMTLVSSVDAAAARERLFDSSWKFHRGDSPAGSCNATNEFPVDLGTTRCMGLKHVAAADASAAMCAQACCSAASCETWQWCGNVSAGSDCATLPGTGGKPSCWIGARSDCYTGKGWTSRARASPPSAPGSAPPCSSPFCAPSFDDASWRGLDVPHDWSIEALPSRSDDSGLVGVPQVVSGRNGTWRFTWADEAAFSSADFDDSSWDTVAVPADWRTCTHLTRLDSTRRDLTRLDLA
jgi:hypothetical protein